MATISDFKNNFRGGVRPNLFQVLINAPVIGSMNLEFLGKATQIPSSTVNKFEVDYRGRKLAVPGDRIMDLAITEKKFCYSIMNC